jgi:hypothetical protein
MLSFMKEQEIQDPAGSNTNAGPGTVPTAGDPPGQDQEYLTVQTKSRNVRKTTRLLAALFGVGLISLLIMIKASSPRAADAAEDATAESQIEHALARLTGIKTEFLDRMDQIVKKFYEYANVQQVELNQLSKNPFRHDPAWQGLEKVSGPTSGDASLLRQQQIRKQAEDLQLFSIMKSDQGNCCMIDNRILYQGDSIKGFSVSQISDSVVRLQCPTTESESVEIILKLSE